MGERAVASTTPVLYLPTVAGSFVTATAASLMGWRECGQLAFGAGAFSWLALESVILHRLLTGPTLPLPLRPTLGIQLAPPAVGALAYLNVGSGKPDIFAQALVGYALLQGLILICLTPWIRAQPFVPAYWSFSFGAAALAGATVRLAAGGSRLDRVLAPLVFAAANLLILALVSQTVRLALYGKLLPPPDQTAAARI
jgi:tellurite resistance protein